MLSELIFDRPFDAAQPAIITRGHCATWSQLRLRAQSFLQKHAGLEGQRVGVCFEASADGYASLAALAKLKCDVVLFDGQQPAAEVLGRAEEFGLGALLFAKEDSRSGLELYRFAREAPAGQQSSVTLLTSGSTGKPKAVTHTWNSLAKPVRLGSDVQSPRWLLTYRPHLYAGLQVALQCFGDGGTLVVPLPHQPPAHSLPLIESLGVQFVSATPSFWKHLLLGASDFACEVRLQQITLGGEVVEQWLLDALRKRFPKSRIVHVYATTELGRCFAVHDGKAGFPSAYLDSTTPDNVQLKLRDGELMVRTLRESGAGSSSSQSASGWIATGDLVAVSGDRAHFTGRKSEVIHSAGSKVHPLEVERIIRGVPGVNDVRVFGKPSPLVGEVVACEVVPEGTRSDGELRELIHHACASYLSNSQWPRLITFVEQISTSASGKTLRQGAG
jgi:acyl-CoA synthetase (AMP-forming)/AMP-acid ligase II